MEAFLATVEQWSRWKDRRKKVAVRGKLLRKDRMTRLVLAVTLIHQAAVVEIHPADVVQVGSSLFRSSTRA